MSFVNDTWFALQVRGENDKPNTIAFYKNMTRMINESTRASRASRFPLKRCAINMGRFT